MVAILAGMILVCSQAREVGLPYGLHSYAHLAEELTSVGIDTLCEPSIRRRCALILIPPRPWESLRPVLEAALGVRFTQTDSGSLEIRKDPMTASTEDALLKRLARRYSQTVEDAVQG